MIIRVHPAKIKKYLLMAGLFMIAITPFLMFFLLLPEGGTDDEPTLRGRNQLAFPYTAAQIQSPPTDFLPEASSTTMEPPPEPASKPKPTRKTTSGAKAPPPPPPPSTPPPQPPPAVQVTREEETVDQPDEPDRDFDFDFDDDRPSRPAEGPPQEDPTGLGDPPDDGNDQPSGTGNDQGQPQGATQNQTATQPAG